MYSRRAFTFGMAAILSAPAILHAKTPTLDALQAAAAGFKQLRTLSVRRGDQTVFSQAFHSADLSRAANIKSCSKSVVALLLGTAIAKGEIASLSARLGDVAPDLIPSGATEGASDLTMEDLVTLRGGLQSTSGGNYGQWVGSGNWVAYALRQPRISPNGARMIYSTGTTHVLGAVLARVTGKSLLQLARERLGQPLDMEIPPWTRDPQGRYFGGNEMALQPQGMLRLAMLMRDDGRYGGQQVIDPAWIAASRNARTQSPYSGLGYGYGWFVAPSGWVLARGYGGQIIAAHPERSLAVAITSDPTLPARSGGYFGDLMQLIEGEISALG